MMDDEVSPALGISRRDVLKRGAVVGGTLVWAAPAVQTISRSALAQTQPGTPQPDGGVDGLSWVRMIIRCAGSCVLVNYEVNADGTGGTWEANPSFGNEHCSLSETTAVCPGGIAKDDGSGQGITAVHNGETNCVVFTIPAGCVVVEAKSFTGPPEVDNHSCLIHTADLDGTLTVCGQPAGG